MVILEMCYLRNCEINPIVIGIQDEHNKNYHRKYIEYYEKFDTW